MITTLIILSYFAVGLFLWPKFAWRGYSLHQGDRELSNWGKPFSTFFGLLMGIVWPVYLVIAYINDSITGKVELEVKKVEEEAYMKKVLVKHRAKTELDDLFIERETAIIPDNAGRKTSAYYDYTAKVRKIRNTHWSDLIDAGVSYSEASQLFDKYEIDWETKV